MGGTYKNMGLKLKKLGIPGHEASAKTKAGREKMEKMRMKPSDDNTFRGAKVPDQAKGKGN